MAADCTALFGCTYKMDSWKLYVQLECEAEYSENWSVMSIVVSSFNSRYYLHFILFFMRLFLVCCLAVCPSITTCLEWHDILVEEFQWNLLQIFIMELELLTSISSLVVKNQGHDQTECYNDRGMHFTGVAWRLHGWFLFNNLEPFCSVYCLHVVYNICSHLTGNKRSHTNTHIYAMQWNAAVKWLTTRSVQTSANAH